MSTSKILYVIIGTVMLIGTQILVGCAQTVTKTPPHDAEYQQFQSDKAQRQLDTEQ